MVLDRATVLFAVLAAVLIAIVLGVVLATRAQRRRQQMAVAEERRMTPEPALDVARWIEEGRQLFNAWQERIERLTDLQSRLEMAHEIGELRAQVARIDELRDEVTRLGQETERLRAERDDLREALGRVAEIVQRVIPRSSQ
jgi:uncharacterized protein HemX